MPPPRILIVDDSALLRSALRGLFNGAGTYEITEAGNGSDALSLADQYRPNVIVLDFAMPGMDGLSVARALRQRLPQIPILMYTMHYTHQLVADAEKAGVRKLISKSDGGDLLATVRQLIASTPEPTPDGTAVGELMLGMQASPARS